jgi:hypothetical protein
MLPWWAAKASWLIVKNIFGSFIEQSLPFMKFIQEYIIIMSSAYYFEAAFRRHV